MCRLRQPQSAMGFSQVRTHMGSPITWSQLFLPVSPCFCACSVQEHIEVLVCTSGMSRQHCLSTCPWTYSAYSFVRSVSMDTWQVDQIRRMKVNHCFAFFFCLRHSFLSFLARWERSLLRFHAVLFPHRAGRIQKRHELL